MAVAKVEVYLANPRGFCAGVQRAIDIVEAALANFPPPVYVRHEVVHNQLVVDTLKQKGATFVDEISEVPDGATLIFSAHGVSQQVRSEANARNLNLVLDATCPLVTKVHHEVSRQSNKAKECILIGHKGHAEVEGTMGQYLNPNGKMYLVETIADVASLDVRDPDNIYYVTQTTLSVDETKDIITALKNKYPNIQGPSKNDICYATQNRQDAVKLLARKCDLILVVGSTTSSNSNRLRELGENCGVTSYLLDGASQLQSSWLENVSRIGITAGASAPEILVQEICRELSKHYTDIEFIEMQGITENISFAMPAELKHTKVVNSFAIEPEPA